jgi:hypothetical protein
MFQKFKNKIYFTTFGNDKFNKSKIRLKAEAEAMNIFDVITINDPTTLDKDFVEKHKIFIENNLTIFKYDELWRYIALHGRWVHSKYKRKTKVFTIY